MTVMPDERLALPRSDVVACELDDETALLDLKSSKYFRLNRTAAFVWDALEERVTLDELCKRLLDQFEVDEERCRSDVTATLRSFQRAGLVQTPDS